MATHSSTLAWRILGTAEPGGLLSMGLHRVGHDWSDLAAAAAANHIVNIEEEDGAALVAQTVKNLPPVQETWVIPGSGRSLEGNDQEEDGVHIFPKIV